MVHVGRLCVTRRRTGTAIAAVRSQRRSAEVMVPVWRRRLIFVCVLWVVPSKAKFLATSSIDLSDDIGHNYGVNGPIYTI